MAEKQSFMDGVRSYKPTKTVLLWSCAGSVALTLIVGFNWGGWMTGETAAAMARNAAQDGRAQLAATICVDKFMAAPDARANLASLKQADSWNRDTVVTKGGWVALPGVKDPIYDSAELCAERLVAMEPPTEAAAGAVGTIAQ